MIFSTTQEEAEACYNEVHFKVILSWCLVGLSLALDLVSILYLLVSGAVGAKHPERHHVSASLLYRVTGSLKCIVSVVLILGLKWCPSHCLCRDGSHRFAGDNGSYGYVALALGMGWLAQSYAHRSLARDYAKNRMNHEINASGAVTDHINTDDTDEGITMMTALLPTEAECSRRSPMKHVATTAV